MKQYMGLMGLRVRDKITGFKGVVECVSFDLYGCVQCGVKPDSLDKDGKLKESLWFDHKRLAVLKRTPVMAIPNYEAATQKAVSAPKNRGQENGPAEKPSNRCS